jgi:hypothetical protein
MEFHRRWKSNVIGVTAIAVAALTCNAGDLFSGSKKITSHYEISVQAKKDIAYNAGVYLFGFFFEAPGASGAAYIDGKKILTFENEPMVRVHSKISAGRHQVELRIEKPATLKEVAAADEIELAE